MSPVSGVSSSTALVMRPALRSTPTTFGSTSSIRRRTPVGDGPVKVLGRRSGAAPTCAFMSIGWAVLGAWGTRTWWPSRQASAWPTQLRAVSRRPVATSARFQGPAQRHGGRVEGDPRVCRRQDGAKGGRVAVADAVADVVVAAVVDGGAVDVVVDVLVVVVVAVVVPLLFLLLFVVFIVVVVVRFVEEVGCSRRGWRRSRQRSPGSAASGGRCARDAGVEAQVPRAGR